MKTVAIYVEVVDDDQLGIVDMAIGDCNARHFIGVVIDGIPFEAVKQIYQVVMKNET